MQVRGSIEYRMLSFSVPHRAHEVGEDMVLLPSELLSRKYTCKYLLKVSSIQVFILASQRAEMAYPTPARRKLGQEEGEI